jgi:hypothetical protein
MENIFLEVPELPDSEPAGESGVPTKARRGRPKQADETELLSIRQGVLSLVENHWHELGLSLPRVKTSADVRVAFAPLRDEPTPPHVIELMLRESERASDPTQLRSLTKKAVDLGTAMERSQTFQQQYREAWNLAMAVQTHDLPDTQRTLIAEEQHRRKGELDEALSEHARLQTDWRNLRNDILDRQAYLARQEFLRFCRSGRYAINPVNVANALAGLPDLGYRQSINKCKDLGSLEVTLAQLDPIYRSVIRVDMKGGPYQICVTLAKIIKTRPNAGSLLDHAREWLLAKKAEPGSAIHEMKTNWYYLSRAVEATTKEKHRTKDLPCQILGEYRRRFLNRSAIDLIFESRERLTS